MKTLLFSAILIFGTLASADVIVGEAYVYVNPGKNACDITQIPKAAKAAVDDAIKSANEICPNPEVLAARVLSVEPIGCQTWNAGFQARAEVDFTCNR